jgi:hypothetical protein
MLLQLHNHSFPPVRGVPSLSPPPFYLCTSLMVAVGLLRFAPFCCSVVWHSTPVSKEAAYNRSSFRAEVFSKGPWPMVLDRLDLAIQKAGILAEGMDIGRLDQSRSSTSVGASEESSGRPKGNSASCINLRIDCYSNLEPTAQLQCWAYWILCGSFSSCLTVQLLIQLLNSDLRSWRLRL